MFPYGASRELSQQRVTLYFRGLVMNLIRLFCALTLIGVSPFGLAQDRQEQQELAKKLNNPVASLITIPMEYNKDANIGPNETGEQESIKFTPVIPFELSDNWDLISRTIVSYVDQDIPEYGLDENGWSDIALALYFTPKELGKGGIIWGVGPLLLLDTATEDSLGAGKWGLGPAGVLLKQSGPWSVGALGHYLTDVAGDDDRADVEQIFLQPFLSYNFSPKTSVTLQTEITRNLDTHDTGAFALFQANRTFKLGSQLMQGRIGVRHWYERMDFGPDSTELNLRLTLIFPR